MKLLLSNLLKSCPPWFNYKFSIIIEIAWSCHASQHIWNQGGRVVEPAEVRANFVCDPFDSCSEPDFSAKPLE